MKMLTISRLSWKYSSSTTSSMTTTLPSAGATTVFSVSPSKYRLGQRKKFSTTPYTVPKTMTNAQKNALLSTYIHSTIATATIAISP